MQREKKKLRGQNFHETIAQTIKIKLYPLVRECRYSPSSGGKKGTAMDELKRVTPKENLKKKIRES